MTIKARIIVCFALLVAIIVMLFSTATYAEARPLGIVTCDLHGCSDWQGRGGSRATKTARKHTSHQQPVTVDARGNPARLITIDTTTGIQIKIAANIADRMVAFIGALCEERGYCPTRVHCYSWGKGHVAGSLHHSGRACDFNQRGWGITDPAMYFVADLAKQYGFRDGCEFADWGHIDVGPHLPAKRIAKKCRGLTEMAAYINPPRIKQAQLRRYSETVQ